MVTHWAVVWARFGKAYRIHQEEETNGGDGEIRAGVTERKKKKKIHGRHGAYPEAAYPLTSPVASSSSSYLTCLPCHYPLLSPPVSRAPRHATRPRLASPPPPPPTNHHRLSAAAAARGATEFPVQLDASRSRSADRSCSHCCHGRARGPRAPRGPRRGRGAEAAGRCGGGGGRARAPRGRRLRWRRCGAGASGGRRCSPWSYGPGRPPLYRGGRCSRRLASELPCRPRCRRRRHSRRSPPSLDHLVR